MSHTPGPWHLETNYRGNEHHAVDIYWVKKGRRRYPIATLTRVHVTVAEFEANARLIAAAPELLEALQPFAYLAQVMQEGQVLNFRGVYVSYEQVQAAQTAIAKAKGETE